jgi:hypothetical protein
MDSYTCLPLHHHHHHQITKLSHSINAILSPLTLLTCLPLQNIPRHSYFNTSSSALACSLPLDILHTDDHCCGMAITYTSLCMASQ